MKKKLLLKGKINREIAVYKNILADLELDEIIDHARAIDTKITIKEILLDVLLPQLSEEALRLLLSIDGVIDYFFYAFEKTGNGSRYSEIYEFLHRNLVNDPAIKRIPIKEGGQSA